MRYLIPAIVLGVLIYIGTKIYAEMSDNQKEIAFRVILFLIGIVLGLIIFANNI
jgi:RsiW-degrading membrane proteinase PrsW (M82 family)